MKQVIFIFVLLLFAISNYANTEIVINEIGYNIISSNSISPDSRPNDFIELYNPGPETINLKNYRFTKGIQYNFDKDVVMAPDSYYVILTASMNPLIDYFKRSNIPHVILSTGKLSNSGERITLCRPDGTVADSVKYADQYPWPMSPDGYGTLS